MVAATSARAADPIDNFIRSPGPMGEPVMAARMFAWCSARYDYAVVIHSDTLSISPKGLRMNQERALGARAAGAYRMYMARAEKFETDTPVQEAIGRDFAHHLSLVEKMAEIEADDIDLLFLLASPKETRETLAKLRGEFHRCLGETLTWQKNLVSRMTRAQITEAKKRHSISPKLKAKAVSPKDK